MNEQIEFNLLPGVLTIWEGNTGILLIHDSHGGQYKYVPDCDLDKARELLLSFQELKDPFGKRLKDNYYFEGFNWYPSMISELYWHYFYPYIMYRPILNKLLHDRYKIRFLNQKIFFNLHNILTGDFHPNRLKLKLLDWIIKINNTIVIRFISYKILFFRFTKQDFRSKEIRRAINELGEKYIEIVPRGRIIEIIKELMSGKLYYYYGIFNEKNIFNKSYNLDMFSETEQRLFQKGVDLSEIRITGFIREFKNHDRLFSHSSRRIFYGFDDCNGYIFPLLFACKKNRIVTIAHQHGAYVRRHAGYILENINPGEYNWFDKIIVWGEYWKNQLMKYSQVYSTEMFLLGSNKLKWDYSIVNEIRNKKENILIPYEFATNSYKIGKYITKLLDLGYSIFFKSRPDEVINDQLEAYCLNDEYKSRITVVENIDSEFMRQIDIIAGSMTTLIYELLPYNKIIWIFDIEFRLLHDMIEDGLARLVRMEDLDNLSREHFSHISVNKEYYFGSLTLKEVLSEYVINPLNSN